MQRLALAVGHHDMKPSDVLREVCSILPLPAQGLAGSLPTSGLECLENYQRSLSVKQFRSRLQSPNSGPRAGTPPSRGRHYLACSGAVALAFHMNPLFACCASPVLFCDGFARVSYTGKQARHQSPSCRRCAAFHRLWLKGLAPNPLVSCIVRHF